jgi:hypothetical protein
MSDRRIECVECTGTGCVPWGIGAGMTKLVVAAQCPHCHGYGYLLRCDGLKGTVSSPREEDDGCGRYLPPGQECGKCGMQPLAWGTVADDGPKVCGTCKYGNGDYTQAYDDGKLRACGRACGAPMCGEAPGGGFGWYASLIPPSDDTPCMLVPCGWEAK